jgi:hypothetical protein
MAKRTPNRARGKDSLTDWTKQLRFDMEYAKRMLLEDGGVRPMFVLHTDDGIIPCPTDMGDKGKIRAIISMLCLAYRAVGVTFIGEAWAMRPASPDDHQRPGESWADWEARTVAPSESERRFEIVLVQSTFYDDAGEKAGLASMREIERGADGKPTGLAPEITHTHGVKPEDAIQGPTFNILPERRASPHEQELAKRALDIAGIKPTKLADIS